MVPFYSILRIDRSRIQTGSVHKIHIHLEATSPLELFLDSFLTFYFSTRLIGLGLSRSFSSLQTAILFDCLV